jgi:hypothetical protein
MANKQIIYLTIFLIFTSCGKKENGDFNLRATFNVCEIKNSVIQDSIRHYHHKNLEQYGKGVVTLHVANNNDTSIFIISSILSSFGIKKNPPSLYAKVDSIPVLIFTGIEREISQDSAFVNEIQTRVHPYLEEVPPNYNPVVWRIKTVSQRIVEADIVN